MFYRFESTDILANCLYIQSIQVFEERRPSYITIPVGTSLDITQVDKSRQYHGLIKETTLESIVRYRYHYGTLVGKSITCEEKRIIVNHYMLETFKFMTCFDSSKRDCSSVTYTERDTNISRTILFQLQEIPSPINSSETSKSFEISLSETIDADKFEIIAKSISFTFIRL